MVSTCHAAGVGVIIGELSRFKSEGNMNWANDERSDAVWNRTARLLCLTLSNS